AARVALDSGLACCDLIGSDDTMRDSGASSAPSKIRTVASPIFTPRCETLFTCGAAWAAIAKSRTKPMQTVGRQFIAFSQRANGGRGKTRKAGCGASGFHCVSEMQFMPPGLLERVFDIGRCRGLF